MGDYTYMELVEDKAGIHWECVECRQKFRPTKGFDTHIHCPVCNRRIIQFIDEINLDQDDFI